MQRRRKLLVMKKAFSIAELVIVACIIGILAALAMPFFQNEATGAKVATARDNLRSAIELYAAQHKGAAPGYENDNTSTVPREDCFRQQTIITERYMRKMPENPFNNLSTMQIVANNEVFPSAATGQYGWIYQAATSTIRLDWPGLDTTGIAYFDYGSTSCPFALCLLYFHGMAKSNWRMVIPGATVFLSSGCIVMLAIVVFRMAAGELGASSYTWTTVLAVALMGLALGSFLGGRIAERFHPRRVLSVLFALSSAACVLAVILNNALKDWTGLWGLYWPLHVFVHVGLLLLMPATLLAAANPVAGKMASGEGTLVGRVTGAILTWGACGSIAGMALAELVVIPAYGNTAAVWSISVTTIVLAFLYWVSCWVLYVWGMVFGVLLLLATSSAPWANQSGAAACLRVARAANVLYESQTPDGSVLVEQISQRPDTRVLWLDANKQGTVLPEDVTYIQDFPAAVGVAVMRGLWQPGSSPSMLFLGSDGYVLPRYVESVWPQSHMVVAATIPTGTAAVRNALGVDQMAVQPIHLDPGACLSALCVRLKQGTLPERFDLIHNQPDNRLNVPSCLVTRQFNDKVSSLLSDKGVYILSVVDLADGGAFLGAVVNTLEQTFPHVQVVTRSASRSSAVEDFVILAGRHSLALAELLTSNAASPAARVLDAAQIDQLKKRCSGIILTDERAPVGTLLTPVVRADAPLHLARKWLRQAVLLESLGQGEQSNALYQQVASSEAPIRGHAYAAIGRRYLSKGETSKAAEAFLAALKCDIEGDSPPATVAEMQADLALVFKKMNELSLAKQHIAAAIKGFQAEVRQYPKSAVAWERLGDAFIFQEDWRGASDAFSHCVELEPDYVTHYDKLAKTLEAQRRYDEAIKVVRLQIALLKKTGRKEAVAQQSQYLEVLEYNRVK
jgi:tetratricopeptide (TPR) repeat protein/type II secretory pathway pseudopilin PulG/MFS family permease